MSAPFSGSALVDPPLQEHLQSALKAAGLGGISSAYVADLQRRAAAEWRAQENIYPASVIKVAIMAEAFHRFAERSLAPQQCIEVGESNQTPTAEETPLIPGYRATMSELVELMVERSDNIATNVLIDVLRRERITAYMRALGLPTFLLGRKLSGSEPLITDPEMTGRNRFPAAEAGRLLELIASDQVPGAAAQREILSRCVHNEKLVPGLESGDRFLHKTGETTDTSHDAGILYTNSGRRYVVVLYTTPQPAPGGADASHVNGQLTCFMRELRAKL